MKIDSFHDTIKTLHKDFSLLGESEFRALALQTRSVAFREYLALDITGGRDSFEEFLAVVRGASPRAILRPRRAALLAKIVAAQRLDETDLSNALAIYERLVSIYGSTFMDDEDRTIYSDLLVQEGRPDQASEAVTALGIETRDPAEAATILTNVELAREGPATESWLKSFNSLLGIDNLAPVQVVGGTAPALDRLEATTTAASVDGPLVTVIIPTYRPGTWVWTAIRSITQQTYANLQILIIDDNSGAEFDLTFDYIASMDARIQVIRSDKNRGTYASRNDAVRRYARGNYVTIQDDDDWSHPQRIERQVAFSHAKGLAVGMARATRVTQDLRFIRRGATFIRRGYVTTMISRSTFLEIGFWDPVRRNSDFEFIRRARRSRKPTGDLGHAPLLLARHRHDSLSIAEVWEGYTAQPRRWQHWLAQEWHDRCLSAGQKIYMGTGIGLPRPYPAPVGLSRSTSRDTPVSVDALVVCDWGEDSVSEPKALALASTLLEEGKSVGLLHVDAPRPLAVTVSKALARLTRQPGVSLLGWGDSVTTEVAHVINPYDISLSGSLHSNVFSKHAVLHGPAHGMTREINRLLNIDCETEISPH